MQTPDEIRRDLPADLGKDERVELVALGLRLQAERPPLGASFRGDLHRKLVDTTKRSRPAAVTSPRATRVLIASYVTSGLLMLAIAAIGLVGSGPFASA